MDGLEKFERALKHILNEYVGSVRIGELKRTTDVCKLQKMYCLPHIRGTGVLCKLMDIALEYSKKCYLETLKNMIAAPKFYEKYGFKRIDKSRVKTEHFACDVRCIKEL